MKAMLISIKPEWVAKILNGEKTIEIRKTAPKCDLPIEVYIYCTNGGPYLHPWTEPAAIEQGGPKGTNKVTWKKSWRLDKKKWYMSRNGKVVAKFTLNKIERFINGMNELELEWDGKPDAEYDYFAYEKALEKACLTYEEANEYCPYQSFYAWHISNLEIFDEPKELNEFYVLKCNQKKRPCNIKDVFGVEECHRICKLCKPLTKAPQSWCYVEGKS